MQNLNRRIQKKTEDAKKRTEEYKIASATAKCEQGLQKMLTGTKSTSSRQPFMKRVAPEKQAKAISPLSAHVLTLPQFHLAACT